MKKIILSLTVAAATLLATEVSAQIKNDKGTFTKPVAGNLLIELQVSPNVIGGGSFNLNDPFLQNLSNGLDTTGIIALPNAAGSGQSFGDLKTNVSPMLKGRYFLSDNSAIRVKLGFITASRTAKGENGAGDATKGKISRNGFALALGYEKHFSGAERLSTYAGADLLIGLAGAKASFNDGTDTYSSKQSAFGFGLRAVTGFDYYFIPKVYLGAELGLGISYDTYGVIKNSGPGQTNGVDKSSDFALTPFIVPAFRLGYNF
jgi:outer membrane protein W